MRIRIASCQIFASILVIFILSTPVLADLTNEEAALDAEIQKTWSLFLERLSVNDAEGAANLIRGSKRKQYLQAFETWGDELSHMADGWSAIKAVNLRATFAEYTIFRRDGEDEMLHFIMFSKSIDGTWQIAEF